MIPVPHSHAQPKVRRDEDGGVDGGVHGVFDLRCSMFHDKGVKLCFSGGTERELSVDEFQGAADIQPSPNTDCYTVVSGVCGKPRTAH